MAERRNRVFVIFLHLLLFLLQTTGATETEPASASGMKHFVLVHGAWHGAWCWYKLVALLKSSGHDHNVTALDLAAGGINPKQVNEVPSISDYFQPLMDFMAALPLHERVILVGHSLGGLAISHAMEEFPHKIAAAVFVTAFMPGPTLNFSTLNQEQLRRRGSVLDGHFTYDDGPKNPPTTFILGPRYISEKLYQQSPFEDVELANMLVRPQRLYSVEDKSNVIRLSSRNYGSVSRVFVIAEKDETLKKDFQEWMIKKNSPHEVRQIEGSDHMVMISKPHELLVHLQAIAEKYHYLN